MAGTSQEDCAYQWATDHKYHRDLSQHLLFHDRVENLLSASAETCPN